MSGELKHFVSKKSSSPKAVALHTNGSGSVNGLQQHKPPAASAAQTIKVRESEHFVQFYEDDAFLAESVSAFVGQGLVAGDGAIVIATEPHRKAIGECLRNHGIDLAEVEGREQFVALDAREIISKLVVNGELD